MLFMVLLAAFVAASTSQTAWTSNADAPTLAVAFCNVTSATFNVKTFVAKADGYCGKNGVDVGSKWGYDITYKDINNKQCGSMSNGGNGNSVKLKVDGAYSARILFAISYGRHVAGKIMNVILGGKKLCAPPTPVPPPAKLCQWKSFPNSSAFCGVPSGYAYYFTTPLTMDSDGTVALGNIYSTAVKGACPPAKSVEAVQLPTSIWLGSLIQGQALACPDGSVVMQGIGFIQHVTPSGVQCPMLAPDRQQTYPLIKIPLTLGGMLYVAGEFIVEKHINGQWITLGGESESTIIQLPGKEDRCLTNSG